MGKIIVVDTMLPIQFAGKCYWQDPSLDLHVEAAWGRLPVNINEAEAADIIKKKGCLTIKIIVEQEETEG